ncbi:hypothetical protein Tco_1229417 [Tanacetum coccineum]
MRQHVGDGEDQGFDSVGGQDNVVPIVPVTKHVETKIPGPKRSKKKRVTHGSEKNMPSPIHPKDYREQGVRLFYMTFLTSSVTLSTFGGGRRRTDTDSVTDPSLRTIGPSTRFIVLSDSSHHSGAESADPEVDSLVRSAAPVITEATTVATVATMVAIPTNVSKDKSAPHPSIFCSSSSSEKTNRTLSLFIGRLGSGFAAGSISAEEVIGAGLEEIYVPKWTVTKGFELNDGHSCANMIDHFTPTAFFKTEESVEVAQLRAQVSGLEAIKGSLRGEVASAKEYNDLLEKECGSLKLKATSLESTIAEKDRELSDLGASSSSLKSQNQSLINQVHELETSSTELREKLGMYEGSLKQLEEFQDNLMRPLKTRLAEIDADFTRFFVPNSTCVIVEALGHAFSRAIGKGMQEGLAAGIEHGQAGRCLTDLEAYIPSAEANFNSAIRDLRNLNFLLFQELSNKKDASTWDIMDLLRLDDAVAETLGMTDLQPDVSQLMVPVHHKQDRVVIGSQALSVALDICRGRVEKMERNLVERLPFLKDVFVSIDVINQVHELETSSTELREKLGMYEGSLKQLEEFQDNLMRPLKTRLAEIDADFTRFCMRFQESFHPHLLNVIVGRRWLLTHGMKLLVVKCLNSTEYMEALGHAFGRAIGKG